MRLEIPSGTYPARRRGARRRAIVPGLTRLAHVRCIRLGAYPFATPNQIRRPVHIASRAHIVVRRAPLSRRAHGARFRAFRVTVCPYAALFTFGLAFLVLVFRRTAFPVGNPRIDGRVLYTIQRRPRPFREGFTFAMAFFVLVSSGSTQCTGSGVQLIPWKAGVKTGDVMRRVAEAAHTHMRLAQQRVCCYTELRLFAVRIPEPVVLNPSKLALFTICRTFFVLVLVHATARASHGRRRPGIEVSSAVRHCQRCVFEDGRSGGIISS